jgi:hypothetical protein
MHILATYIFGILILWNPKSCKKKDKCDNEDPSLIEFFRETHTNRKTGCMSAAALEAYVRFLSIFGYMNNSCWLLLATSLVICCAADCLCVAGCLLCHWLLVVPLAAVLLDVYMLLAT